MKQIAATSTTTATKIATTIIITRRWYIRRASCNQKILQITSLRELCTTTVNGARSVILFVFVRVFVHVLVHVFALVFALVFVQEFKCSFPCSFLCSSPCSFLYSLPLCLYSYALSLVKVTIRSWAIMSEHERTFPKHRPIRSSHMKSAFSMFCWKPFQAPFVFVGECERTWSQHDRRQPCETHYIVYVRI